jgi:hypothetical protein
MNGYGPLTVPGETRTLIVTDGQFGDVFAATDVHIDEIDLTAVTCDLKRCAPGARPMMGGR